LLEAYEVFLPVLTPLAGTSLPQDLSRVITTPTGRNDSYSEHHTSNFKVTGRHVLNIWRIMRGEVTLTSYTLENIVFHVLHQR
jgi:DNA polymerase zeta